MKNIAFLVCTGFLMSMLATGSAFGSALGTATQSVIPGDVQQIISVNYRALRNSPTAQALKNQVLPQNLKQFEGSLRGVGIDPEKELENLTFASFRSPKQGLKVVGVAEGQFSERTVLKKLRLKKVRPAKYSTASLYPMGDGMEMSFLDNSTLLFGDASAVKAAIDARDGNASNLAGNSHVSDLIGDVESEPVWSVLDAEGTQTMMRSALGQAAQLADFNLVKKRLLGSRYIMNFSNGVNFDLDVLTSDSMMASTLANLVKAGMMYRKMSATPTERLAMDSTTVDSDSSTLKVHFRSDDNRFESLLHSDLFAAVSR
jgi:hypothetical protein